ncbi:MULTISPECIES: aminotransferase class III-fold pyridoxal phosphate-dependent enzyme [unclassified Streptomyces]|uniref:aspartate aminotransferase family protein n=1 Tax=unclassified Streptomyces TaxID=2593676 RepID=UPI00336A04DB
MTSDLLSRHRTVMPSWLGLNYAEPIEIVSGQGCRVVDAAGRSYLDFYGAIMTNILGYDIPEVSGALERQLRTGVVHCSTQYLIRGQVEFAEKVARLSGIPDAKVYFVNSGSEAVETALLLATAARGTGQVLALRGSYHGRSYAAAAVTGNRVYRNTALSPLDVHYLHGADRHLPAFRRLSDEAYVEACTEDLRHILATATADDVACLLLEPVQGSSGFRPLTPGLVSAFKKVLDEEGILLLSDEVQTAWGRTGRTFFAIHDHGVTPDAMIFAKGTANGLPIGGVVARGELMDGLPAHGISTFGGNPLSMAAANATLDYVLEHDLQANAAEQGAFLADGLRAVADHSALIADVRGRGLMVAIDLVDPTTGTASPTHTSRLMEETKRRGLLAGKGGLTGETLRLAPPLTLSRAEAEEGLAILRAAIEAVEQAG